MNETIKNITRGLCFSGLSYQETNHPVEPSCDRIRGAAGCDRDVMRPSVLKGQTTEIVELEGEARSLKNIYNTPMTQLIRNTSEALANSKVPQRGGCTI